MVLPHKDSKDVFILGGTDEIQQNLDDSNINVATIASSRHVGPIKSKVDEWTRNLDLFGKTLVRVNLICDMLYVINVSCLTEKQMIYIVLVNKNISSLDHICPFNFVH